MEKITWPCNKCTLGMKYVQKNFRSSAFGGQPNPPSTIGHQTCLFFCLVKNNKNPEFSGDSESAKVQRGHDCFGYRFRDLSSYQGTRVLGYYTKAQLGYYLGYQGTRVLGYQGTRVLQCTIGHYWILYTRVHQGTCTKATKAF